MIGERGRVKGTQADLADLYPAMTMAMPARDAIVVTFGTVARVRRVPGGDR